jgi:hypothetical protein
MTMTAIGKKQIKGKNLLVNMQNKGESNGIKPFGEIVKEGIFMGK